MKTALVTGAYKGLGFEWCRQLGSAGYAVVLTARDLPKAEAAAAKLKELGIVCFPKALNVTEEKELAALAAWVDQTFGSIDLIINNAGINPKDYPDKAKMAKAFFLDQLDAAEMLAVLHINSLAPLLVVKHFRHLLKKSDHPLVVNMSSWLGSVTHLKMAGHYGYVGSKNLLNILNKAMANELMPDKIICVNVNPGWVQTDMGGKKAHFTPEQAVANLLAHVVHRVTMADSGKFLNYDGAEHVW